MKVTLLTGLSKMRILVSPNHQLLLNLIQYNYIFAFQTFHFDPTFDPIQHVNIVNFMLHINLLYSFMQNVINDKIGEDDIRILLSS